MVYEKVLITDFTNSIILGSTYDFKASFFNTSGLPDSSIPIVWTSSDNSILSINYNGLATAEGIGKATITVTANMISTSVEVEVPQPSTDERIALLEGKSGYKISGSGVIKLMNREVILNFTEVKVEGPGPYFYLSNSQSNVNGGVKLGISKDGSSFFNVSQIKQGSTLGDYKYIIVWCEPFGVTLGFGVLGE
ncbi:MAG: DM13 domain-containing protein [Cyclobacteriaceae bacterium]|nr:DM13 domain-containing protein [Cyclobacteriaceae bacterium]